MLYKSYTKQRKVLTNMTNHAVTIGLLNLLVALVYTEAADIQDTCYPLVGCFSNQAPWISDTRMAPPPQHPQEVATTMYLYTQEAPNGVMFPMFPEIAVNKQTFNKSRPNFFIIHGYGKANATAPWVMSVKDSLMRRTGGNVFIPAWGAKKVEYEQAASNARIVGKLVGMTIQEAKLDPSGVHIVSHCIGTHVAGYAAKIVGPSEGKKIARITAMDPAAPMFEGYPPEVRLDVDDADFVDVYHTDIEMSGMAQPAGHLDFYFNAGTKQPGCDVPTTKLYGACSHGRAEDLCAEMMDADCMMGQPADVITNDDGNVIEIKINNNEDMVPAGLTTSTDARGIYFITTNEKPPFCSPMAMAPPITPKK